jgi:hypothetical protein
MKHTQKNQNYGRNSYNGKGYPEAGECSKTGLSPLVPGKRINKKRENNGAKKKKGASCKPAPQKTTERKQTGRKNRRAIQIQHQVVPVPTVMGSIVHNSSEAFCIHGQLYHHTKKTATITTGVLIFAQLSASIYV